MNLTPVRPNQPHPISHESLRPRGEYVGRRRELSGVAHMLAKAANDPRFPHAWRQEVHHILQRDTRRFGLPGGKANNRERAAQMLHEWDALSTNSRVSTHNVHEEIMRQPTHLQPMVMTGTETTPLPIVTAPNGLQPQQRAEDPVPLRDAPVPPDQLAARPPIRRREARQLLRAHDVHVRTRPIEADDPQAWYYQERRDQAKR